MWVGAAQGDMRVAAVLITCMRRCMYRELHCMYEEMQLSWKHSVWSLVTVVWSFALSLHVCGLGAYEEVHLFWDTPFEGNPGCIRHCQICIIHSSILLGMCHSLIHPARYVSFIRPFCKCVGAALGVYEELQLWDALVVCYRLLDKRSAAEDLLRKRLKVYAFWSGCSKRSSGSLGRGSAVLPAPCIWGFESRKRCDLLTCSTSEVCDASQTPAHICLIDLVCRR